MNLKLLAAVMALALVWAAPVYAEDPVKLEASVSSDHLPPGSAFRLTITIRGDGIQNLPEPLLPQLKNFEIVGKSSSQQISMINMNMVVTKSITYQVVAQREGSFRIPPVSLKYGGKTYVTEPITMNIDPKAPAPKGPRTARRRTTPGFPGFGGIDDFFPGSGAQRQRVRKDDLMAKMEVDKNSAVPFDPIVATFSFYSATKLWKSPSYDKPKFEGFWVEPLPFEDGQNENTFKVKQNDRIYRVQQIRYALIPISPGTAYIDPATIVVSTGPWSSRSTLRTDPIEIEIRPFPEEGRPAGFTNMVIKDAAITAEIEPAAAKVNDSLTLRLVISGEGYFKPVDAPEKPVINGFEVFEPKVTDEIDKSGGRLTSRRVVEFPMIAREEGEKTINPITLAVYDSNSNEYVTLSTKPLKAKISPAAATAQIKARPGGRPIEKHGADIRYIKPDMETLADAGMPLHRNSLILWIVLLLPAPLLIAGYMHARKQARLATDTGFARKSKAAKSASQILNRAKETDDSKEFFAAIDQAMRGYLADKWNLPAPSITKEMAQTRLGEINGGLSGEIENLFDSIEMARYTPSTRENMDDALNKVKHLISALEKEKL